jgi:hypothetical protein
MNRALEAVQLNDSVTRPAVFDLSCATQSSTRSRGRGETLAVEKGSWNRLTEAGLVELVMSPRGSRAASNDWSYPDFLDLRDAETGLAINPHVVKAEPFVPHAHS